MPLRAVAGMLLVVPSLRSAARVSFRRAYAPPAPGTSNLEVHAKPQPLENRHQAVDHDWRRACCQHGHGLPSFRCRGEPGVLHATDGAVGNPDGAEYSDG